MYSTERRKPSTLGARRGVVRTEDSSELMCLRPVPAQPRPPFSEARTECPGGGGPASAPPEPASGASASPTSLSSEGCSGGEPSGGDPSGTEPSSGGSSGAHGASEEGSSRCAAERRLRAREERHEYSAAGSICCTASPSTSTMVWSAAMSGCVYCTSERDETRCLSPSGPSPPGLRVCDFRARVSRRGGSCNRPFCRGWFECKTRRSTPLRMAAVAQSVPRPTPSRSATDELAPCGSDVPSIGPPRRPPPSARHTL
mmetsp:Transcript_18830/g.63532  ORF Transcript_18830/g.63532 Transcript_18830/m.63532 type:complete len:257 (-) Transcript_18830:375-1145(-)